jgi:hypothetical protein
MGKLSSNNAFKWISKLMFSAAKICLVVIECQFNRKGMRGCYASVDTAYIRSFIIMQAV